MGDLQNEKVVLFLVIIVATSGIVLGNILSWKVPRFGDRTNKLSAVVMVENTPMVDGVLPIPRGFPLELSPERAEIVESATTYYPHQQAKQLSVSYLSSDTMQEKYNEYRSYMLQAGYNLTEGGKSSDTRTLSGDKGSSTLSITISNTDGKTLVELSYLSK